MDKITATIKIDRDKIFNEVAKLTSYMGAKSQDSYDNIFMSDDEQEFLERAFILAHSECAEMLYPHVKREIFPDIDKTETDEDKPEGMPDGEITEEDVIKNESEEVVEPAVVYDIILALPKHFSHTTITLVENLVHEYLVSRLMSEWVMITAPEKHFYWIERYAEAKRKISIALTARTKPLRRILRPF